jgi:cyclophilin family peptidyl-prolyl cis-trans isomerase
MNTPHSLHSLARLAFAGLALSCFAAPALAQMGGAPATKSADSKPADAKPAETKAEEKKPAPAADVLKFVSLETNMGSILLELNETKAPISVANFLSYVESGHYTNTVFHRVVANFVIQGGGYDAKGTEKETKAPIKNEWRNGLLNKRGTLAMARTNDPDSATAQFYVNLKDNDFLSQPRGGAAYAVFGRVVQGMDVVDKIGAVPVGANDVPRTQVLITGAKILSQEDTDALLGKTTETKQDETKKDETKKDETKKDEAQPATKPAETAPAEKKPGG